MIRTGVDIVKKESRVLRFVEKSGLSAMSFASEKASCWLIYQEEEPQGVKELLKRRAEQDN